MSEQVKNQVAEEKKNEDLSQLVEALKETVMELRETVTELTNPLNKLSYGDAEIAQEYKAKVKAIPLSKSADNSNEEETPSKYVSEEAQPALTPSTLTGAAVNEEKPSEARGALSKNSIESLMNYVGTGASRSSLGTGDKLQRIMRLMRVVFNLRGKVPPELLERYIEIFVGLKLISKEDADLVKNVLKAINEGYASGLGPEEQILLMTLLAKGLGINDEVLEEEALRVIAENLVKRHSSRGGDGPHTCSGEATNKAG